MPLVDIRANAIDRVREAPNRPLRVAVIGCGPKGLLSIQQLTKQLESGDTGRPLSVTIFEPAEFPGAGLVYEPRQPHYLRMNFAAEHINVWQCEEDGPSLLNWLRRSYPEFAATGLFVPRALVGKYLHDCYLAIVERLEKRAHLARIKEQVVDLVDTATGWRVVTGSRQGVREFDEVLLTVGHEGWRSSAVAGREIGVFDIPHVYPTNIQLSPAMAPAQSHIAIRGIGLTAIDAILALTEGRGGKFRQTNHALVYEPLGDEPATVYPYSRSGRPMLAKPNTHQMSIPDLEGLWEHYAGGLATLATRDRPLHFKDEIWPTVESAAKAALCAVGGSGALEWFESWLHCCPNGDEFRNQLSASVEVAMGRVVPDAAWAMGEAWRQLYPTLVDLVSHDGMTKDSWPHFRALAAEMERVAFGPPVENCLKFLALIDCGLVCLTLLQGTVAACESGCRELRTVRGRRNARIDCHVNAVLPSPLASNPRGPLSSLAQRGKLVHHDSGCGYQIDRFGCPIAADGQSLCGVTLVGRPTEGAVLGNDTLNPGLHHGPSLWAKNIFEQLQRIERSTL
ncbi:FAD/NAD(P)-binding protein [Adhaeretor mobilis]|uniref:FAD-dependent urate hydroxylase HpyO/Asp monooxygenase CreE-like FAD/NAD(P)-binding domain-containing protein n=1 Tax=Adhaeretor mobilis TaxID=1930276 RepID=A0A517MX60_9BACT|nr:FAD/NAD(P)-binding protein [Adhaeretor mobilis]QDS99461.1 hypothetical protein HG15A2_27840 [Adhaeretor mobilis]